MEAAIAAEGVAAAVAPRVAFTRYCHCQYCMVYGIHKGVGWGVAYCALVVQWYCNSVSNVDGGGSKRMID